MTAHYVKKCCVCKEEIEANAENFAMTKRTKDGFSNVCKPCKREYDKAYRMKNKEKIKKRQREHAEKNKEKISEYQKEWREKNAEHLKAYREKNKYRIQQSNKKYWAENKEYAKQQVNKWRKENAEYIREYRIKNRDRDREQRRKWTRSEQGRKISMTKTNAYRAKKKTLINDFTAEQWSLCLERFGHSCAYCGKHHETLEQEHFVPVSKGGHFTKNNILPACRTCNASKNNHDYFEWYTAQKFFSEERHLKILKYLGKELDNERTL